MKADVVIIGSGIFGLFAARQFARRGKSVVVVERDSAPYRRASLINQARLHQGYHYPRSLETGHSAREFYQKFRDEFSFSMGQKFQQIYAIANLGSMTSAKAFESYCEAVGLPLRDFNPIEFLKGNKIERAYLVEEETFDASVIAESLLSEMRTHRNVHILTGVEIEHVHQRDHGFLLKLESGEVLEARAVVNTSYAGINQVHQKFGYSHFSVEYELAEILTGDVPEKFKDIGVTVMDGPFFSLMPWGQSGRHSLSAVQMTPRYTSKGPLPLFPCMKRRPDCSPQILRNCNDCPVQPATARVEMMDIARSFLVADFSMQNIQSHFAVKTLLASSEYDDSRPTIVQSINATPPFVSILSGKINTVFRIEELVRLIG